jgi:PDZ domain
VKYLIAISILALTVNAIAAPTGFIPFKPMPTQQEFLSADYGSYPNDYENIIKNYMQDILKDPESARYTFLDSPKTGWNGKTGFGYFTCAYVNSKNSYGGYSGKRLAYFMIQNGKVTDSVYGKDDVFESVAQTLCTDEKYRAPDRTLTEIDKKAPNMSAPSSNSKGKSVLGVNVIDLPPSIALGLHHENMKAALIVAVNPSSVSDKAGIKVGDVIYEFDGKPIEKFSDLPKAVSETAVGRKVLIKLLRGDKELSIDAQF